MTTGKTIALTIWTFVDIVMSLLFAGGEAQSEGLGPPSLLFNTLSRFVIAFLPRSKDLLISWQQPPSALTLEPKERKSVTASIFSLSICHEVMGPDAMIFVF